MLHVTFRILVLRLGDLCELSTLLCRYNGNQLRLRIVAGCLDLLIVLDDDTIDVERWRIG